MRELSTRHIRQLFALIDDAELAVVEHATNILADAALAAGASMSPAPATAKGNPE
jgi:hypothetical protein